MSFFNRIKSRLAKDAFVNNFITLLTGSLFSQIIPIVGSVVLARLYGPADFALLALFLSIVNVISIISTGRYEFAIVLPNKDKDAVNIVYLSLILVTITFFIVLFIVIIFNNQIGVRFDNLQLNNILFLIPITVFIIGVYQIVIYWFNRKRRFVNIAKSRVFNNGTNTGFSIILGMLSTGNGMVISTVLSTLVTLIVNIREIVRKDLDVFRSFSRIKLFYVLKKYKKFPLVNSVHALINTAKESYINIFISFTYTSNQLGFYYLVIRIMKLPVSLIGSSISQVLLSEAKDLYKQGSDIGGIIGRIIKNLFFTALIPVIIVFFWGGELFSWVFGSNWEAAGEMASAISPYILFHFIASPLGSIPLIVNKQGTAFFFGIIETLLFLFCFLFGHWWLGDLISSLYLLSFIMPLFFIVYFRWIYIVSKKNE